MGTYYIGYYNRPEEFEVLATTKSKHAAHFIMTSYNDSYKRIGMSVIAKILEEHELPKNLGEVESSVMKEISRYENEETGATRTIYELNGYKIEHQGLEWGNIIYIRPIDSDSYLPQIFFEGYKFGKPFNEFKIQTTAYGAMKPEEIDKVIEGYRIAQATVNKLNEFFGF